MQDFEPIKAKPFSLTEVSLKDSAFKEGISKNAEYLRTLDPQRLLHTFRLNAGIESNAQKLGGWESPYCELRGHFIGHYLSACAILYAATGDEALKQNATEVVKGMAACQAKLGNGYLSAFPESYLDKVENKKQIWAPWYTLHKLYAGMLDMYNHTGSEVALEVLIKMTDWAKARLDKFDHAKMQEILKIEYGGMPEVFANLYKVTGNPEHLDLAIRFNQDSFIEPLIAQKDELRGYHANTQIPKILGLTTQYEVNGAAPNAAAAKFFWEKVTAYRCYATGGTSNYEYWREEPTKLSKQLGSNDHECCCTHNMLKLSRQLFTWEPDSKYFDYYERALYNGILGTQHPVEGGAYMYYVAMRPGSFRHYCHPDTSFVCCSGTGIESFSKFNDSIYFHTEEAIYINLFIASEVDWQEKGLKIIQKNNFPESPSTNLEIKCKKPTEFRLKTRIPKWSQEARIYINGIEEDLQITKDGYSTIKRVWVDGDQVKLELAMKFHLDPMPDNPNRIAVMYGPIAMAGALGTIQMSQEAQYGMGSEEVYLTSRDGAAIPAPNINTEDKDPNNWFERLNREQLEFRTKTVGTPAQATIIPFYKLHGQRYTIYWDLFNQASLREWQKKADRYSAEYYDSVIVGDEHSDDYHNFQAYKYEAGQADDANWVQSKIWIRYDLNIDSDCEMILECKYAKADADFHFEICIDGKKIALEKGSKKSYNKLIIVSYSLPLELTQRKSRIGITFKVPTMKDDIVDATVGETTVEKINTYKTPRIFGCATLKKRESNA